MKYKVTKSHVSNYPEPISFNTGDALQIGESDIEYEGWVKVTITGGLQGWAPKQYIDNSQSPARATTDYSAKELNTTVGEVLQVHTILNQWGWVTNGQGESGWVPMETLQPYNLAP